MLLIKLAHRAFMHNFLAKDTSMYDLQQFTYFSFLSSDPMMNHFALVKNLAICFKRAGSVSKNIQFCKYQMVIFFFIMLTLFEFFIAKDTLDASIKLIGWVLIARLVGVAPVPVCILNLSLFSKHFLMNQSACQCVPETHHVEPVDSCKQVVLLLPE